MVLAPSDAPEGPDAIAGSLAGAADATVVETTLTATATAPMAPAAAVLVVLRPDGHVGAVAEGGHADALRSYCSLLRGVGSP